MNVFYVQEDAYDGSTWAVTYARNNQIVIGGLTREDALRKMELLNTLVNNERRFAKAEVSQVLRAF